MSRECEDPLPALYQSCLFSEYCGENAFSDDDFPFLTSVDEPTVGWVRWFFITYDFTSPTYWLYQVALVTLLTWVVVTDPAGIIPIPFDDTIPNYISNVAIGTFLFAAYGFFSGIATEQVAQFRGMGNAVTSFAGDLRGAFTPARARQLLETEFEVTMYEGCEGNAKIVSVPGATTVCWLAMILQSSVYGTTRFLTEDGIDIDLLPLKFRPLYNEVVWNTSIRNQNQLSVMMRMALEIVQKWSDAGIVSAQAWGKAANNVGDFNSAIGGLAIAKQIRPNKFSNNWLGFLILVTLPFIPLSTTFSDEIKVLLAFLLAFVLYRTLALRQAESNVTDLENPLAGIRLKDEDDPIAYAAVAEIAGIISMAGKPEALGSQVALSMATAKSDNAPYATGAKAMRNASPSGLTSVSRKNGYTKLLDV